MGYRGGRGCGGGGQKGIVPAAAAAAAATTAIGIIQSLLFSVVKHDFAQR